MNMDKEYQKSKYSPMCKIKVVLTCTFCTLNITYFVGVRVSVTYLQSTG